MNAKAETKEANHNVLDLVTPVPIQYANCDRVAYSNNTRPSGVLIQDVDIGQAGSPKQSELTTSVDDAYLLAL